MGKEKFALMKKKLNVGDTVAIHIDGQHLVSGIVYICSSIPMGKFYSKQFGKCGIKAEDCYEDALVLIDNRKPGTLAVLTMEERDNKFFTWNDVFGPDGPEYKSINDQSQMKFDFSSSLLTEMTHSFK